MFCPTKITGSDHQIGFPNYLVYREKHWYTRIAIKTNHSEYQQSQGNRSSVIWTLFFTLRISAENNARYTAKPATTKKSNILTC